MKCFPSHNSMVLAVLFRQVTQHLFHNTKWNLFDHTKLLKVVVDQSHKITVDPKQIETLILHLRSPSNEQRSQAESQFNLLLNYPSILVLKLVNLVQHSPDFELRATSAILLRNILVQDEEPLWNRLSESTRVIVKSGLLNCVEKEKNKWIIRKLADTISELTANILADNDYWPELMPFMFNCVKSEDFRLQESALLIFTRLAQYVEDSLVPHITDLHDVFMRCLGNVDSADVRIAALIAVTNFIHCLKNSSDRDRFQDLLPGMMRCLKSKVLNDGDEATAQEVLNLLIELAKTEPRFFRGHLVKVVDNVLQIAKAESLEEGTRHLAIEFVITLVEAREPAPRMMRGLPQLIISRLFAILTRRKFRELLLINRLFVILMRMLFLDIEDDTEWNSAKNEDEDESSNYRFAKECLHRLATALGGKIAYEQLSEYLVVPDREWQKRLAALVALAQIAKGRSKVMIPNLEQVVTMVLNSFQDPHPRVRWAAINTIGQLFAYLGPYLQDQDHEHVLPALALALHDVNPRVQAHVVYVVLNFSSHCRPHILAPYLNGILNKLIELPPTEPNIRVLKLANSLEELTYVRKCARKRARYAVDLGKMFEKPLAVLTLVFVQRKLLTCVEKEENRKVRECLCHTIATFFNVFCIKTGWPELFSSLERWASGDNDLLKEAAMLILGPVTRVLTKGLNGGQEVTTMDGIGIGPEGSRDTHGILQRGVINIFKKLRFFLVAHGLKKSCSSFCIIFRKCTWSNCVPVTTQEALFEWAHQSHETKLLRHLKKYFSGRQLVGFVSNAIEIAQSQSLKKETRHLAIDFVITLGEGRHSGYCVFLIKKLFGILMSDIENEVASRWAENENDDAGESGNCSVVQKFLNRLAFKLDKYCVAWPMLEDYLTSPDGQKRAAAIVALAPISKVLKETKNNFEDLFAKAINNDIDPRVSLVAINETHQLFTDLDPDMPLPFPYHSLLLSALGEAISDFNYLQLQERAASAMINISIKYPPDTSPYLRETVVILLEEHASSRLEMPRVSTAGGH